MKNRTISYASTVYKPLPPDFEGSIEVYRGVRQLLKLPNYLDSGFSVY